MEPVRDEKVEFLSDEKVRIRAVREDLEATVVEHEGDLVLVRFNIDGREARVPVSCVYR